MSKETVQRGNFTTMNELKTIFDNYITQNFSNEENIRYNDISKRRRKILRECIDSGKNTSENLVIEYFGVKAGYEAEGVLVF